MAAAQRYAVETGGIVVGGVAVRIDRESQGLILGLIKRLEESPNGATQRFKGVSGWVDVDLAMIKAVGMAVGAHVGAAFDREGELVDLIEAAEDVTSLDEIDITVGWPS